MKQETLLFVARCAAVAAHAQSFDAPFSAIIKDSKKNFEQLTALDKSDKAIKAPNNRGSLPRMPACSAATSRSAT